MAKIWEIHYTTFSGGGSNEPQDSVGTSHITSFLGTAPSFVQPIPTFNVRKGVLFEPTGGTTGYNTSSITNARFGTSNYTQRSFVVWFYKVGSSDATGALWGDGTLSVLRSGIRLATTTLQIMANNVSIYSSATGFGNGAWHNIIVTVDTFAPRTKAYLNNVEILNTATVPSTVYTDASIGDLSTGTEINGILGYTATYNHILTVGEIQDIYDSFLVDSNNPANFPYAEISGKVFDQGGFPLPGADVTALNPVTDQVVAHYTTTSGGDYLLQFEAAGTFKIVASKPGILGGRVVEATVSGGQVSLVTD